MSGCGCSFTPVENKETEEIKYTDALAEQFAAEVGVDPRPNETLVEIDERGAFIRQPNAFIQPFGDKEGDLKAEANRFGIYWATGCNWSNRPIIVRELLGLQDMISETRVSPSGETNRYGHAFGQYPDFKDPATGAYFLSEFYKRANPDFKGRATTPTLVDVKEKKAVNNDYHRLTNYLEVQFRPFQPKDAPDLYPKKFRKEIDEFNDWLFPHVNNGHYRMAFCQSPEAYDEAYEDFYESLDKLDKRLETNRFLFGDYITDSDVRAYVTLIRWDVSYFHNVGPVKKPIRDYKNIWGYLKELYAIPAFRHGSDPPGAGTFETWKEIRRGSLPRIQRTNPCKSRFREADGRRWIEKNTQQNTGRSIPSPSGGRDLRGLRRRNLKNHLEQPEMGRQKPEERRTFRGCID